MACTLRIMRVLGLILALLVPAAVEATVTVSCANNSCSLTFNPSLNFGEFWAARTCPTGQFVDVPGKIKGPWNLYAYGSSFVWTTYSATDPLAAGGNFCFMGSTNGFSQTGWDVGWTMVYVPPYVPPPQPPSVTLTSPANGTVYTAPASIALAANASSPNAGGSINRVEFLNGSTLLNTDTAAPYAFTWSSVPAGTYTISARATDNVGGLTVSTAATVTVNGPATYTISGSAGVAGATVAAGSASATSDASGNYTLSALVGATYTVTASKSGCTFTPASLSVTVGPNATGKNFTATCGVNGASFRTQSVPAAMTAGQVYAVSVTFQNSGTSTWTYSGNYRLGSQNPQDNTTWGANRVSLNAGETVAPGASRTFSFNVTAPATGGNYNFQWKMLQEGLEWFGNTSTNVAVAVTSATYSISGNAGTAGATVTAASSAGSASATSDASGNYSVSGLVGATYTVTASKTGCTFSSLSVTVGPNATGKNLTATCSLSPALVGVASRKVHGTAGTFDLPLNDVPWNPTTEPRAGPTFAIVFTFNGNVTGGSAAVTEGHATAGAPTFSGTSLIVPLTGVVDAQYVTIAASNVSTSGGGTGGSGTIRIGFLAGDVDGSRVVTNADAGLVNAQLGQLVSASNYKLDVDASGTLAVSDVSIVNADLTHALPAPGVPPVPTALKRFSPGGLVPGQSSVLSITLNPKLLYVPTGNTNTVVVINTADNTVLATLPVAGTPLYAAVNATGTRAYVTSSSLNAGVWVIDTATNTVLSTISGVVSPGAIAVNPVSNYVYVANTAAGTVSVISVDNATVTIPVGVSPGALAVNPIGTRLYVPNAGGNTVTVLDTANNNTVATIAVGTAPKAIAFNPAKRVFYVANSGSNSISIVDAGTNTVITTVGVGTSPIGLSVNPSGTRVFVANSGSNSISVFDSMTYAVVATIPVGTGPSGVAFNPAGTKAFVSNSGTGTLSVIDTGTNTVTGSISTGGSPTLQANSIVAPFAGPTTGAAFNDTYPAGLINTTPASPATTCGGTVSAANGGNFVSLSGGTIPANDSCAVTVNVMGADPQAGIYTNTTGPITSTNASTGPAASGSLSICGLPSVTLATTPSSPVTFGMTITLNATAGTATGCGAIQHVDFLDGSATLNSDLTVPYSFAWTNATVGTHNVSARAFDSFGQTKDAQLSVVVQGVTNQPPTISSVTPSPQTQIALGGTATFTIVATDPDAASGDAIQTVQLLRGTQVIATGSAAGPPNTFVIAYTPTSAVAGDALTVKVTDKNGASAQRTVTLTVVAAPVSVAPAPDQVVPTSYPTPLIGTIGGTFAVADSGAASYSIPIQVPPGTAGMQPNLAIAYNSQAGYGHMGVGWSLSGLSSITRCPKTIAQDGNRTGINYDSNITNDAFCLDGQRLVRVGGPFYVTDTNYSSTGTAAIKYEYRTELDSFTKIESYEEQQTSALYGPYRFRAWTKSGQVMDYGSRYWVVTAAWTQGFGTNGSLQQRANAAKVWVLDRAIDRAGNFMEIDYADRAYENPSDPYYQLHNVIHMPGNCSQSPGALLNAAQPTPIGALPNVEFWPTAIRYYAKGAVAIECGNSTNNQVRFVYQDIPSQASFATRDRYYDSGAGQTSISKRLTQIVSTIDGIGTQQGPLVSNYYLTYDDSAQSGRSLLELVTQCSVDNIGCLPPTQFTWAANDAATGWNATGTGFVNVPISGVPFSVNPNAQPDQDSGVYVADWNGDGKSDVLGWVVSGGTHTLYVCLSSGTGFSCGPTGFQYSDPAQYKIELVDVDNDGKADLLYAQVNSGIWSVCISTGGFACTGKPGNWSTVAQTSGNPTFRGDIDGDGRIDVITNNTDTNSGGGSLVYQTCLAGDTGFNCFTQNLAQTAYTPCPPTDVLCETFGANHGQEVLIADANGDGKADLLLRHSGDNGEDKWKVCLSDFGPGLSNTYVCHDRFIQASSNRASNNVLFDFNGDGLVDLAAHEGDFAAETWRVCLATGDGAFEFRDPFIHWNGSAWVDSAGQPIDYYNSTISPRCRIWTATSATDIAANAKAIYGDFNGDGRTDIAAWYSGQGQFKVCLSTGSAFNCSFWSGPYIPNTDPDLNQWLVYGDFNGDGKTDILILRPGSHLLWLAKGPPTGDVITKITTGLGATTSMTYAPLTDATVYAKGSGADASQRELDIQSPLYVVKHTDASNGVSGNFVNDYFYENLRGRTDGRGLYGFAKKRSRDGNGIVTEVESLRVAAASYPANWPIVGRPLVVRKYAPTTAGYMADISQTAVFNGGASLFGGSLRMVNRATNTWEIRDSLSCNAVRCGGTPVVREANLQQALEESWELNGSALPTTTTTMALATFDSYGNPGQVTVSSSDGYSKVTTNTYANDAANWVLGRLTAATVTATKPGTGSLQRASSFTYHGMSGVSCAGAALGFPCDEIIEPGGEFDASTSYSLWQKTSYQSTSTEIESTPRSGSRRTTARPRLAPLRPCSVTTDGSRRASPTIWDRRNSAPSTRASVR